MQSLMTMEAGIGSLRALWVSVLSHPEVAGLALGFKIFCNCKIFLSLGPAEPLLK